MYYSFLDTGSLNPASNLIGCDSWAPLFRAEPAQLRLRNGISTVTQGCVLSSVGEGTSCPNLLWTGGLDNGGAADQRHISTLPLGVQLYSVPDGSVSVFPSRGMDWIR